MAKRQKKLFVVVDEQSNLTSCDEQGGGEGFGTEELALKRARDLAQSEPGVTFWVMQGITAVTCPVGEPVTEKIRS